MKEYSKLISVVVPLVIRLLAFTLIVSLASCVTTKNTVQDIQLQFLAGEISQSMMAEGKSVIAVSDFPDIDGNIRRYSFYVTEELTTRLFQTGKFKVIERNMMEQILRELELTSTDLFDSTNVKQVGKMLGVDAIVVGSLAKTGKFIKINARIISVETAEVLAVSSVNVDYYEAVQEMWDSTVEAVGVLEKGEESEIQLGTEESPITWAFVPAGEIERAVSAAQSVADLLYNKTGLYFSTSAATEYADVIEAMASDPPEVHMASLDTFAYVLAADRGAAEATLVSVRFGSPTYSSQFIVRADSGISKVADLKGKTFARPDPMSTSGSIVPMLAIRAAGINPEADLKEIIDAGSHVAVVAAVYNKDVDAGATYVDARVSLEKDHSDIMDKVVVLKVMADIPNDGLQFVPSLPKEMRDKIVKALFEIAATKEGKEVLETAYGWNAMEKHDDSFYDIFRQLLQTSGLTIEEFRQLTNR